MSRFRDKKAMKITEKEGQAVYDLTIKLAKQNNLTYEQVQECYK